MGRGRGRIHAGCAASLLVLRVLLRARPVGRRALEAARPSAHPHTRGHGGATHISECGASGLASLRRAISVFMNLLYGVSFFFGPPGVSVRGRA
jgi:hypothetical protein